MQRINEQQRSRTMNDQISRVSRRSAAGLLGLAGVSAIGAAVAPARLQIEPRLAMAAPDTTHTHDGEFLLTAPPVQVDQATADDMDATHEAGVKAFPAKTAGLGGQSLPFTMD